MSAPYIAFAVDPSGTALARYDVAATDEATALKEAKEVLTGYPVIEVWDSNHRRIGRFKRPWG
jgi:hypothetical protein